MKSYVLTLREEELEERLQESRETIAELRRRVRELTEDVEKREAVESRSKRSRGTAGKALSVAKGKKAGKWKVRGARGR